MRNILGAIAVTALVLTSGGCGPSPAAGVIDCPGSPAAGLGPDSDPGGGDLMDDIKGETIRFAEDLVGMATDQARACAADAGYLWRVYQEDGEPFALTMDYVPTRINVAINQGIITDAYGG